MHTVSNPQAYTGLSAFRPLLRHVCYHKTRDDRTVAISLALPYGSQVKHTAGLSLSGARVSETSSGSKGTPMVPC
jgi:hypothetical protein